jgi:cysteinyl-tRNA synthetase
MDLKFPHHECEIAQNTCATGEAHSVRYWMHGNMLTVNGRKMAKSEGNGFTPEELISGNHALLERGYSPMTVRFFMLQGHYASTLDFSNEALQAAEKGLDRLMSAMGALEMLPTAMDLPNPDVDVAALSKRCSEAMGDDFNTPILISVLFDAVKLINSIASDRIAVDETQKAALVMLFNGYVSEVLGLVREDGTTGESEGESGALLDLLVELRGNAKINKDWGTADAIRDALGALSISIKDSKEGSTWERD